MSDSASSSVQLDACDSAAGPGTETGALKRARGGDDAASPDGSAWHSDAESSCSALNREEWWCSGNIWPSTSSSSHAAPVTDIICSKSERLRRRPKSYEWDVPQRLHPSLGTWNSESIGASCLRCHESGPRVLYDMRKPTPLL